MGEAGPRSERRYGIGGEIEVRPFTVVGRESVFGWSLGESRSEIGAGIGNIGIVTLMHSPSFTFTAPSPHRAGRTR